MFDDPLNLVNKATCGSGTASIPSVRFGARAVVTAMMI